MYPNINRGDRKRERQWRHGERNRKRERQSWDTVKEENASLFLTERLSVSLTKIRVHSPFWFYQSKKQKREDDTNFSVKNEKSPLCPQTKASAPPSDFDRQKTCFPQPAILYYRVSFFFFFDFFLFAFFDFWFLKIKF